MTVLFKPEIGELLNIYISLQEFFHAFIDIQQVEWSKLDIIAQVILARLDSVLNFETSA